MVHGEAEIGHKADRQSERQKGRETETERQKRETNRERERERERAHLVLRGQADPVCGQQYVPMRIGLHLCVCACVRCFLPLCRSGVQPSPSLKLSLSPFVLSPFLPLLSFPLALSRGCVCV